MIGIIPNISVNFITNFYRICFGIVQRKEDAEDVTQEVFTKLYLNIHTFNEQAKLSTWMYRIALNQSNEFLRKSARKKREISSFYL